MRISHLMIVIALFTTQIAPAGRSARAQSTYARAGWTAQLSTLAHGVSGKATIVDERTVVLSMFNYDAAGPRVFAYLGTSDSQQAFINGIPIGGRLNNRLTPYVNEVVTLTLPAGQTLDNWNALSIWCSDFNANFGSGAFVAPPQPPATATPNPTATTQPAPTTTGRSMRLYLPSITR
jgi:hypothetical protein